MREIQLHDAEATLADVVDSARNGEPSVITRHGRPEAVVLGFDDWERLSRVPSFARLLMADAMDADDDPDFCVPD
jgi:prevent-host-death family protein